MVANKYFITFLIGIILFGTQLFAQTSNENSFIKNSPQFQTSPLPDSYKREPKYFYTYIDREHTFEEDLKNQALMYGLAWLVYPISQPKIVRNNGGFKQYKKNFGKIVFDNDEPFWNWFVHPISGSQLYLYYRADGYSRIDAFQMSLITSALFEFTVEVLTEPASIQDLYQTPVLGSLLGLGIENLSLYLLNTGNPLSMTLGHMINPATLLPNFQGKLLLVPLTNSESPKPTGGYLSAQVEF
jgi:hypothetical protein